MPYGMHAPPGVWSSLPDHVKKGFGIPNPRDEEDLVIQQLREWADIEDFYDKIPWTITSPTEEENFYDYNEESIHRDYAHARAGPPSGQYWTRVSTDKMGMPLKGNHGWMWKWFNPKENAIAWPTEWMHEERGVSCEDLNLIGHSRWSGLASCGAWMEDEEDDEGRIVINGFMTNKGMNYMKASTPYGSCYIDLKFTKYVPDVGEPLKVLCRFQSPDKGIAMKCIKVLQDWQGDDLARAEEKYWKPHN
jgi:hypothetical protein